MIITKSIDIEDEIRRALGAYMTTYVRPLPADYRLPHILITQVGGTESQTIDTFAVVLDSRAKTEAEALDYLNTAIGVLKQVAKEQESELRYVAVNSSGSWGNDPVRPDLAMCSARLEVVAHQKKTEILSRIKQVVSEQGNRIVSDDQSGIISSEV